MNRQVTEADLDKYADEARELLYGHRIVPMNLRDPESPERPAHEKAGEQAWREDSGRWSEVMDYPDIDRPWLGWRGWVTAGAVAAVVVAAVWVFWLSPLWSK